MSRAFRLGFAALFCLGLWTCGSSERVCTSGAQSVCACASGGQGVQVCDADGRALGPCICGGSGGSGGDGGYGINDCVAAASCDQGPTANCVDYDAAAAPGFQHACVAAGQTWSTSGCTRHGLGGCVAHTSGACLVVWYGPEYSPTSARVLCDRASGVFVIP